MTTALLRKTPRQTPPPERQHLVLEEASWGLYDKLLREVGDRAIRLTYDQGRLEIMSPLPEHERPKRLIGRMIETLTLELNLPVCSFGSSTFRRKDLAKGLEPDECYYFKNESRMRAQAHGPEARPAA